MPAPSSRFLPLGYCIFFLTVFCSELMARGAVLDGKQLVVTLFHKTTTSDTQTGVSSPILVGPDVELTGFGFRAANPPLPALVDIDISNTNILITLLINQPLAAQELLTFSDSFNNINPLTSAIVSSATNWSGFSQSRVSFGSNSVSVMLNELQGTAGQQISIDLTAVPECSSAGLAIFCCVVELLRVRIPLYSLRR